MQKNIYQIICFKAKYNILLKYKKSIIEFQQVYYIKKQCTLLYLIFKYLSQYFSTYVQIVYNFPSNF